MIDDLSKLLLSKSIIGEQFNIDTKDIKVFNKTWKYLKQIVAQISSNPPALVSDANFISGTPETWGGCLILKKTWSKN